MSARLMTKAVRAAYEGILLLQARQEAIAFALNAIPSWRGDAQQIRATVEPLRMFLVQEELDMWRKLFMWSLSNGRWVEKAKALARDRFLSEHTEIMSYLGPCNEIPRRILLEDRKAWRREIDEAFPGIEANKDEDDASSR